MRPELLMLGVGVALLFLYRRQQTSDWLSPSFHISEFTQWMGKLAPPRAVPLDVYTNLVRLARVLEVVQAAAGKKVRVVGARSGWRPLDIADPGVNAGEHTAGLAADIVIDGMGPWDIRDLLEQLMRAGRIPPGGIGVYAPAPGLSGDRMVHYDLGASRRWWGDTTPHFSYPNRPGGYA